jgi:hypothetical protein
VPRFAEMKSNVRSDEAAAASHKYVQERCSLRR